MERVYRVVRSPLPWAVLVGLLTFLWVDRMDPADSLGGDAVRDQLLARDCIELGRCHLSGAHTSYRNFYQGTLWVDLVIAVRVLGGDEAALRFVVLLLIALSGATLFIVAWRWLSASIAVVAAIFFAATHSQVLSASLLTNPSAAAFPNVLASAGLLLYALSGQRRFLILSALGIGLAIDFHFAAVGLVVPFLVIGASSRPQPWSNLLASFGVLVAVQALSSPAALYANLIVLGGTGIVLALVGATSLVIVSARLGARFRKLPYGVRASVAGVAIVVPFVLLSAYVVFWTKHHFGVYYLHPIMVPVVVLASAALCVPFALASGSIKELRSLPAGIPAGIIALLLCRFDQSPPMGRSPQTTSWRPTEARVIAEEAARRGWSYDDLVFRLQSDECYELLREMSMVAPPPQGARRKDQRQLQVVKLTREQLARNHRLGDALPIGSGEMVILRETDSWLRPHALRACQNPTGGSSPLCSDAVLLPDRRLPTTPFSFLNRSLPQIHFLDGPLPYVASYEFPLAPTEGEHMDVRISERRSEPHCGWRFTAARGVEVAGGLPAERVRLYSADGSAASLVVEKTFGSADCTDQDTRYPPCLFEMKPGDPLRELLWGS
jgi:hypothetical protein